MRFDRNNLVLYAIILIAFISIIVIFYYKPSSDPQINQLNVHIPKPVFQGIENIKTDPKNTIVLVTAYYKMPSKASSEQYIIWMENFLSLPNTRMVIFTDSEFEPLIRKLRCTNINLQSKTRIIVKPFESLEMWKSPFIDIWSRAAFRDPEIIDKHHSKQLYALWAQKSYFVEEVISIKPFGESEWVFWCDIGCCRDKTEMINIQSFPNDQLTKILPRDKMIVFQIPSQEPIDKTIDPVYKIPKIFLNSDSPSIIQGGFFGGHQSIWPKWCNEYKQLLLYFDSRNIFCGKDQTIMNTIYFLDPNSIHVIQANDTFGSEWFYFRYYFCNQLSTN